MWVLYENPGSPIPIHRGFLFLSERETVNSLTMEETIAVMTPRICQQCGACCRGYAVEIRNKDIKREPRLMQYATAWKDIEEAKQCRLRTAPFALLLNGDGCPFLNEQSQCSIYMTRPQTCRNHPPCLLICHASRLEERGLDCTGLLKEEHMPFNVYAAIILSINPEIIPPIGDQRGVNPRRIKLVDLCDEDYLKEKLKEVMK